ncbi:MAG: dihydroorotase, partial [Bacteroidota bacterium]|nr:dihydroorotase [Bacteroidota bacterium]
MNALIKSAKILDEKSDFNNKIKDILIADGRILKIDDTIKNPKKFQVIDFDNLHISQGWFDSSVCFGEPGYEDRETIKNGLNVAAKSGFTSVALQANTQPVMDQHSAITFAKNQSYNTATRLLPVGALTVNSEGTHLAEIYDMSMAGSVAFGDYKKSISNSNILKIGLQYASNFGGLIQSFPQESKIAESGVMNENISSTKLGLKGNPELAEILQVGRDLDILEYTGGKLHIPTISTAKSVELLRAAKAKGLDVSCSVAIHNLIF